MAFIQQSDKLSSHQEEYRICSKPYVFLRLISDRDGFRLMTATASEDGAQYRAYDDQEALVRVAAAVFAERDLEPAEKQDHKGRPYIETRVSPDDRDLKTIANIVLNRLGFEDNQVLAHREMKAIYDEFAIDDSGEDTYLSDGVWITSDGRLIEK